MRKELMDKLKRSGMPGSPATGMDGAFQHPDSEISPEGGSEEEDEGQALTPLPVGGTSLKPGIKKPKA